MSKSIILFETDSPEERAAHVDALTARGLLVDDGTMAGDSIRVGRDENAVTVSGVGGRPPMRLSRSITPADLATFLQLATTLDDLQRHVHVAEDAESPSLLAAMVAHDANNVLVPTMLAARELAAMGPASVTELAQEVSEGCEQLASMMRRLSTIQRGAGTRMLSMNGVLARLLPMLRTLAGAGVQLTTIFEDPLPPVQIDPVDLERSALNLVANARDAMPGGGQMTLSTSNVWVESDDPSGVPKGHWLLLELEDEGIGMDEATTARAFEAFFTTKPAGRGTGLGLASVMRAVRSASGHVRIHSELGKGTIVQIWLPV